MPKFFVTQSITKEESFINISGEDFHHISDVLRMQVKEKVSISDVSGNDYLCEIEGFEKSLVKLRILDRNISNNEPGYVATLYQGIPKFEKMELIIQKGVELGVSKIIPVMCIRSISKFHDKKDIDKKLSRWNKIAYEAAKQTGRSVVPVVMAPVTLKEAVKEMQKAKIPFIPYECERDISLKDFLNEKATTIIKSNTDKTDILLNGKISENTCNENNKNSYTSNIYKGDDANSRQDDGNYNPLSKTKINTISFMVGPEGGFASEEIEQAKAVGIELVTLGKRILRTETVALAVLSMLLYEFEL